VLPLTRCRTCRPALLVRRAALAATTLEPAARRPGRRSPPPLLLRRWPPPPWSLRRWPVRCEPRYGEDVDWCAAGRSGLAVRYDRRLGQPQEPGPGRGCWPAVPLWMLSGPLAQRHPAVHPLICRPGPRRPVAPSWPQAGGRARRLRAGPANWSGCCAAGRAPRACSARWPIGAADLARRRPLDHPVRAAGGRGQPGPAADGPPGPGRPPAGRRVRCGRPAHRRNGGGAGHRCTPQRSRSDYLADECLRAASTAARRRNDCSAATPIMVGPLGKAPPVAAGCTPGGMTRHDRCCRVATSDRCRSTAPRSSRP